MVKTTSDLDSKRPWARTRFDIEGWVFALAALLFGIFAGAFWYPLFTIGILAAIVVLAATRTVERELPHTDFHVLAPCDGVVSAVGPAVPPSEFEMDGDERVRVRISSSPLSPNTLFAPMTGAITAVAFEEGDPARVFATRPDTGGLEVSYLAIGSDRGGVALKIMTGGFGPRLDVGSETGDLLRAGRKFAKRRLGGWCDVYLPSGMVSAVWPGQTIVGGETELASLDDTWIVRSTEEREEVHNPDPSQPEPVEPELDVDLEELGTAHSTSEQSNEAPQKTPEEMFERLRREAQGVDED